MLARLPPRSKFKEIFFSRKLNYHRHKAANLNCRHWQKTLTPDSFRETIGRNDQSRFLGKYGFATKIAAKTEPKCIRVIEYFGATHETEVELESLGWTRHQSAARFVAENKGCLAFAISQDHGITVFSWNEDLASVIAIKNIQWLI